MYLKGSVVHAVYVCVGPRVRPPIGQRVFVYPCPTEAANMFLQYTYMYSNRWIHWIPATFYSEYDCIVLAALSQNASRRVGRRLVPPSLGKKGELLHSKFLPQIIHYTNIHGIARMDFF